MKSKSGEKCIMKVLIIDDSSIKAIEIKRALERNQFTEFVIVDNQADALKLLSKNSFDLIVSDMHYPLSKGVEADTEAGFKLIQALNDNNIATPVIICSSLNWNIPDIFGVVWYNKNRDLYWDFREILTDFKKTLQKNNCIERNL